EVFGWHVQIPVSSLCAANLALAMSNFLHPVSKLVHRKAWFFRGLDRKRPENQAQARVWQRGRVRRNVWSFASGLRRGKGEPLVRLRRRIADRVGAVRGRDPAHDPCLALLRRERVRKKKDDADRNQIHEPHRLSSRSSWPPSVEAGPRLFSFDCTLARGC